MFFMYFSFQGSARQEANGDLEKLQFFEVNLKKSNFRKGIDSLAGIARNL
jgi:hypothetical protein